MALVDNIVKVHAKGNDIKRKLMERPGVRVFLLKGAGETKALEAVAEITSGTNVRHNDFRGQLVIEHADVTGNFRDLVAQSSYIGYGVPTDLGAIDVYSIDPDRRDVIPPTTSNPFWKVYGTREVKKRFVIP